jgi:hypothetical protein
MIRIHYMDPVVPSLGLTQQTTVRHHIFDKLDTEVSKMKKKAVEVV